MMNEIKQHSEAIKRDIALKVQQLLKESNLPAPKSISVKIAENSTRQATILITIKD